FSQAELQAVVQPFLNRPLSFADLLQARAAVTQLYLDKGYVTSGAYLPANQIVKNGIVTISIVEGSVEDIRITGLKSLQPSYLRDRLKAATQAPLNINRLNDALQRLKQDPLLSRLSAEVLPGTKTGSNILAVSAVQSPSRELRVFLNNQRSAASGEFARQVSFQQTNLTRYGDILNASYTNTDGSHEVGVSYALPINPQNGTLSIRYGQSFSKVVQKPFDALNLRSTSRNVTLQWRQPVLDRMNHQLAVGVAIGRQESETTFLSGFPFSIPESGADAKGRIRITQLNLFQEWTQRDQKSLLALRSDFGLGLDLGATDNRRAPDGQFLKWQGQAQWIRALTPRTTLTLQSTLQVADRPLPNPAVLDLGGIDGLRGYPQDVFLFDQAVLTSAALEFSLLPSTANDHGLYFGPFIDVGYGWNLRKASPTQDRVLVSPGLGLRYEWSDRIGLQINWGIPIVRLRNEQISPGFADSRVLFSLEAKLF
ncbi:MAG TPA: POTRA domain-containing protein, partial [Stenomitos sp.]